MGRIRAGLETGQASRPDRPPKHMRLDQRIDINKPQILEEGLVARIKLDLGFEFDASIADMQDTILKLLNVPIISVSGAVLILERKVDPNEPIIKSIFSKTPEEAFKFLLFLKEIEDRNARISQFVK